MRVAICAIILVLIITIVPAPVPKLSNSAGSVEMKRDIPLQTRLLSYTPHDQIVITSDDDFAVWPGSGTENDPYVIEGLSFDLLNTSIFIQDVTVHFVIRNCYFTYTGSDYRYYPAIWISSTQYALIENNTFDGIPVGIRSEQIANKIEITNCSFVDTSSGIVFWSGGIAQISNCTFEKGYTGIQIDDYSVLNLQDNTMNNMTGDAVRIWTVDNAIITRNVITLSSNYWYNDGIQIYYSNGFTIADNLIVGGANGIRSFACAWGVVQRNIVRDGNRASLSIDSSSNLMVVDNFLDRGIYIYGTVKEEWVHSFVNNSIRGKMLGYFVNESDITISDDIYGQIIMIFSSRVVINEISMPDVYSPISVILSTDITMRNITLTGSGVGIAVLRSKDVSIQECSIETSFESVKIRRSSNIEISNCKLFGGYGISGENTRKLVIEQNTFYMEGGEPWQNRHAINLYQIDDSAITGNLIKDGDIIIYDGYYTTISDNVITFTTEYGVGIGITSTFHSIIKGNSIKRGTVGINVYSSGEILVENNSITQSMEGLFLSNVKRSVVTRNEIVSCAGNGIAVYWSYRVNFTRNVIWDNAGYGIKFESDSDNCMVYHNEIGKNYMGNAYDDGIDNIWDDSEGFGNYWSDYNASGKYEILGDANSVDNYPMFINEYQDRIPFLIPLDDVTYDNTNDTEVVIEWYAWDSDPVFYTVLVDGQIAVNSTWDGDNIAIDLSYLDAGAHTVTLWLVDERDNRISDTVRVTIGERNQSVLGMPLSVAETAFIGILGVETFMAVGLVWLILQKQRKIVEE